MLSRGTEEECPAPEEIEMDQDHEDKVVFSAEATTIDPSVVSSRIRQSASILKQDQMVSEEAMSDAMQPVFPQLSAVQASGSLVEYRRVRCPPHRYTPLREYWEQILTPLVEYLKLQVGGIGLLIQGVFVLDVKLLKFLDCKRRTSCCTWTIKAIDSRKPRSVLKQGG